MRQTLVVLRVDAGFAVSSIVAANKAREARSLVESALAKAKELLELVATRLDAAVVALDAGNGSLDAVRVYAAAYSNVLGAIAHLEDAAALLESIETGTVESAGSDLDEHTLAGILHIRASELARRASTSGDSVFRVHLEAYRRVAGRLEGETS